jgi:hypothetical protein
MTWSPADSNGRIGETFVLREYSRRVRQMMCRGVSRTDAVGVIDAEMFGDCSQAEARARYEQENDYANA